MRRQERTREFSRILFGEPAWEMVLELYIRETAGVSTTTAQLKVGLEMCAAVVARWLLVLEQEGLVGRLAHPLHAGTEFVELTDRSREALERYLASIQSLGTQRGDEPE